MANSDHSQNDSLPPPAYSLPPQASAAPVAQPVNPVPAGQIPSASPVGQAAPVAQAVSGYPPTASAAPVAQPVAPQGVPVQSQPVARAVPVGQAQTVAKPQAVAAPAAPQPRALQPTPVPTPNRPVPVAPSGVAVRQPSPEQEAEDAAEKAPPVLRAAPPWLISLLVHKFILMIAALLFIAHQAKPKVEIFVMNEYAEEEGKQLEEEILDFAPLDQIEFEEASLTPEDLPPVEDPLATPPITDVSLDATSSMSEVVSPTIGMALTGREAGMKMALLAAYGGNATTEAAVKDGLLWLKKQQRRDGSWSLVGPYKDGGGMENKVAATAMALLAFQGAGHTHQEGEFKDVVVKGWNWLLKQQHKSGSFVPEGISHHHQLYTHAQATIAICELYGMTEDSKFRDAAQKAIDFSVKAQGTEGGWRYQPGQDSDTSVTGWYVMALQSALMAKLEVPSPTLEKIHKFLDTVAIDGGRRYEYQPDRHENLAMSAEGLLCRQYLGWKHDDPRLVDGVARFVASPVDYNDQNVYYWYYGTQAAHHMEGESWDRWNRVMRQKVPENQTKSGPEAGSWSPTRDEWGARGGGRLFTTCLSIYMLEVYYRHLPIYSQVYKFRLQQF